MQKIPIALKILLWIILLLFMTVLTKKILLKGDGAHNFSTIKAAFNKKQIKRRWAHANLQPLATIELFYYSHKLDPEFKLVNLGGNVVGFIPLGILLPMLISFLRKGWQTMFAVFLISLGFETTQLFFNLGVFDVDDLILNTAGGIIGYIIYWIGRSVLRYQYRTKLNAIH